MILNGWKASFKSNHNENSDHENNEMVWSVSNSLAYKQMIFW